MSAHTLFLSPQHHKERKEYEPNLQLYIILKFSLWTHNEWLSSFISWKRINLFQWNEISLDIVLHKKVIYRKWRIQNLVSIFPTSPICTKCGRTKTRSNNCCRTRGWSSCIPIRCMRISCCSAIPNHQMIIKDSRQFPIIQPRMQPPILRPIW